MKTFIIFVILFTGGTTTLNIEAFDEQEALEIAQASTDVMDNLIVM
jgi:capsule polysaccharide export protein KpsE/RkpR